MTHWRKYPEDREEYVLMKTDHNEEARLKERCFLIKTIGNADESMDYCTETDRICTLVTEKTCGEWERIKQDEKIELEKGVGA